MSWWASGHGACSVDRRLGRCILFLIYCPCCSCLFPREEGVVFFPPAHPEWRPWFEETGQKWHWRYFQFQPSFQSGKLLARVVATLVWLWKQLFAQTQLHWRTEQGWDHRNSFFRRLMCILFCLVLLLHKMLQWEGAQEIQLGKRKWRPQALQGTARGMAD